MHDLIELLEGFGSPRVVLVGDYMLDRYVYGDVERISPEAPVPVLKVVRSECRTGAAGNVARAIVALGGRVTCVGAIGQDPAGDQLSELLRSAGAETSSLMRLGDRPTTVKTRYVGLAQHKNPHQILRVDEERTDELSDEARRSIKAAVKSRLSEKPIIAFQDHDKGLLDESNAPGIIAEARKAGCVVVVDPAVIDDYRRYRGATLLTPNRYEASLAAGTPITDDASLENAARRILLSADADAVAVTLDMEGIFLLQRDSPGRRLSSRPREAYDGTGAGDEVLAAMAVALGAGCDFAQAAALANEAGGLEVERFGVVPVTRREIINEIRRTLGLRGSKLMERAALADELARRRAGGERVVFTNGCFDLLHMGHVRYLRAARELGSCLVVAVNSGRSVRELKGAGRPVIGQDERAEMLASLECVDYVTIFDEDTPIPLIELLRPELLVKGGSTPIVVGAEIVEAYGGKVMTLDLVAGASTTEIINRIVDNKGNIQGEG